MDPFLIALLGFLGMFVLIGLHIPIGIAMAVAGVVGFGVLVGWQPAVSLLGSGPVAVFSNVDLAVIPVFLLMGSLASVSGLSADIYRLAYAMVGRAVSPRRRFSVAPASPQFAGHRSRLPRRWGGSRSRKC